MIYVESSIPVAERPVWACRTITIEPGGIEAEGAAVICGGYGRHDIEGWWWPKPGGWQVEIGRARSDRPYGPGTGQGKANRWAAPMLLWVADEAVVR